MNFLGFNIDQKPVIIAEVGINHNGNLALAKEMIDAAVENGADIVKFQTFTVEEFYVEDFAKSKKGWNRNTLFEDLKSLEFSEEEWFELKEHADQKGIMFLSTPFSPKDVDLLAKLNVKGYKIASMDLSNPPFIRYIAQKGNPLILSVGMSTIKEIDIAIESLIDFNIPIALLYCVSLYPPTVDKVHLRSIETLKRMYPHIPIGYSDHTIGIHVPIAAITMGAQIIEKHFTIDKNLPGPDQKVSMDPTELRILRQAADEIWSALGQTWKVLSKEEIEVGKVARRSVIINRNMKAGEVIKEKDITLKRPGTGIPPYEVKHVIGRTLKVDVPHEHILQWEDLI